MERREFIKKSCILSSTCILSSLCLNISKNKKTQNNIQETLPHVEFMISKHCNLNCAYCSYFSPLAPPPRFCRLTYLKKTLFSFAG